MPELTITDNKINLEKKDIIKLQLILYCYINKIELTGSDIDCLTLLGLVGQSRMDKFCSTVTEQNIYKTSQTVRNCIAKAVDKGLIKKHGISKKLVELNEDLNIQTLGNMMLNYKLVHIESR